MIGGITKSSRLALLAAMGLAGSVVSAQAADLGGNCCADLEERVAELEATTARKGNRKVSLEVSGQVNEAIMFFDDGRERNTYIGTNMIAQSRFRFVGKAAINAKMNAGYLLEIGVESPSLSNNTANNDDVSGGALSVRHSAWWIEHKDFGKVWVGQTSQSTDGITEINLANTGHFASQNSGAYMGGFAPRTATNNGTPTFNNSPSFYNILGGRDRNTAQIGEGYRFNVVKYDSPILAGFIASASAGEDDVWDVALRYAGEFSGFKIAGGIGYSQATDGNGVNANDRGCIYRTNAGVTKDVSCQNLGLSGSIMHVPTGLFVHGAYGWKNDDNATISGANGAEKKESTMWYLQGGIEQNFFGIGRTTLFGEYQKWETGATQSGLTSVPTTASSGNANTIFDSANMAMWGVGLNQSIDAAAMDVYLHYRNYFDISSFCATTATPCVAPTGGTLGTTHYRDFQTFMAGAMIKF